MPKKYEFFTLFKANWFAIREKSYEKSNRWNEKCQITKTLYKSKGKILIGRIESTVREGRGSNKSVPIKVKEEVQGRGWVVRE